MYLNSDLCTKRARMCFENFWNSRWRKTRKSHLGLREIYQVRWDLVFCAQVPNDIDKVFRLRRWGNSVVARPQSYVDGKIALSVCPGL